jgi:predicted secreted hydrolase
MRDHRSSRFWILVALLAGVLMAAACRVHAPDAPPPLDVIEALAADTAGYDRARGPRPFRFPDDHGPHPGFRTEWWYYTGNLFTSDGRRFGYQFTLFRTALRPATLDASPGSWATRQLYMAHFALSDVHSGRFVAAERFSRGAAGLAGAQPEPYRVWLEDWEAGARDGNFVAQTVRASAEDVSVALQLDARKPIILHGESGYDRKGPEPGNASYYYAVTRWQTSGTVRIGSRSFQVSGSSWLDREWSTSLLGEGVVGWDWFALQLDDGRDVMYYQLRDERGNPTPFSGGVLIMRDGSRRPFGIEQAHLTILDTWRSPRGGSYPSRWRLDVPHENLSLEIDPVIDDQELDVSIRYWEGAVDISGTSDATPVTGVGYAELTGYADRARGR